MQKSNRQTFTGDSMAQAMIHMLAALGQDAVPIATRRVRRGGFLGLGARERYEVVGEVLPEWLRRERAAAKVRPAPRPKDRPVRDDSIMKVIRRGDEVRRKRSEDWISDEPARPETMGESVQRGMIYSPRGITGKLAPERKKTSTPSAESHGIGAVRDDIESLRGEIQSLRKVAVAPSGPQFEGMFSEIYERLSNVGIPSVSAAEILERVKERSSRAEWDDRAIIRSRVAKELARLVRIAPPLLPASDSTTVLAAIGPTGVGKTTTLAKLGAILAEEEGRRIAYITLDNYRIGAAEQLRTFGDILGVPCESVTTPDELRDALARHMDKDFILLDTAGRSPYHKEALAELKEMLEHPDLDPQMFLVVSAAADHTALEEAIRNFTFREGAQLVFTKVDEAPRWGPLFAAAMTAQLPIAYLTTGQSVPEDIEPAIASRIVDAVLGPEAQPREAGPRNAGPEGAR